MEFFLPWLQNTDKDREEKVLAGMLRVCGPIIMSSLWGKQTYTHTEVHVCIKKIDHIIIFMHGHNMFSHKYTHKHIHQLRGVRNDT